MKLSTIILSAMLATTAHAEVIATMPNNAGGQIKLTDNTGNCAKDSTNVAYSTSDTGAFLIGCWFTVDDDVFISFDGGRIQRAFKVRDFSVKPTTRKQGATL